MSAHPPSRDDVVTLLRSHRDELGAAGMLGLWLFGSMARGEASATSDVDLIANIDPSISLTGAASLRSDLADILGRPVDLCEWRTLRPHVAEGARRDAVRIF